MQGLRQAGRCGAAARCTPGTVHHRKPRAQQHAWACRPAYAHTGSKVVLAAALDTRQSANSSGPENEGSIYRDLPTFEGWLPTASGSEADLSHLTPTTAHIETASTATGPSLSKQPVSKALPVDSLRLGASGVAAGDAPRAGQLGSLGSSTASGRSSSFAAEPSFSESSQPHACHVPEPTCEVEQCAVTHPGSLACTSAGVQHLPDSSSVVITLRATIRQTEAVTSSSMLELEELGWMALKNAASQHAAALRPVTCGCVEHDARHTAIMHRLTHGRVIDAAKSTNQFGHVSFVVTLEDDVTKVRQRSLCGV